MPNDSQHIDPVVIGPLGQHTSSIIFLHGMGESTDSLKSVIVGWQAKAWMEGVKFILPQAKTIPIALANGKSMPAWYNLKEVPSVDPTGSGVQDEDKIGIAESAAYLHSIIESEIAAGIPAGRIMLGGFSQGGATAIFSGLTAPVSIAGVFGFSTWAPVGALKHRLSESEARKSTPVLIANKNEDPAVKHALAANSAAALQGLGFDTVFKTYAGNEHSTSTDEINEVERFLEARLTLVI